MKRIIALMIVFVMMFIRIPCSAESGFYCEYSPKTEKSTVFYIDIYSTVNVSAAVMELSFDEGYAEYRDTSAAAETSTVRSVYRNGLVRVALADSGTIKGKLCRVAFKALQAGTCTFNLHISQASDGKPKLLSGFSDSSIEVKLGKDDIVEESAEKSSSKTSSKAEKSGSSSKSYLQEGSDPDVYVDPVTGEIIDLRKNHSVTYILIGAGFVILIAALIFAGIMIGRKTANKKKKPDEGTEVAESEKSIITNGSESNVLSEQTSDNENSIE